MHNVGFFIIALFLFIAKHTEMRCRDKRMMKRISQTDKRLGDVEEQLFGKRFDGSENPIFIYKEVIKTPEFAPLYNFHNRLERIESCARCPMCQGIGREDTQETSQKDQ